MSRLCTNVEGVFSSTLLDFPVSLACGARLSAGKDPGGCYHSLSSVCTELRQQNARTSVWFDDKEVIAALPPRRKTRGTNTLLLFSLRWLFHASVTTVFFHATQACIQAQQIPRSFFFDWHKNMMISFAGIALLQLPAWHCCWCPSDWLLSASYLWLFMYL